MKQPTYYDLVYAVVREIPLGRVSTYGAIADYLALGASRMVGWALNQCAGKDDVPAHRVVNRKGELSGRHHWRPPSRMQEMMESEGIQVENDTVVHFKTLFWHPSETLGDHWEPFEHLD